MIKKIKNKFLNFVFKFLAKFSKVSKERTNRVLIISTTAIGDTLWATPSIEYLYKIHHCQIDVLTSTLGYQILQNNPFINKVIYIDKKLITILKVIGRCLNVSYDNVFLFHASQRIVSYIGYMTNSKRYYGFDVLTKINTLFTQRINYADFPFVHESDMRLKLIKSIYPEKSIDNHFYARLQVYLTDNDYKQAQKFLAINELLSPNEFIFIQPGTSRIDRQWHPDYFAEVIEFCVKNFNKKILISGSKKEKELVNSIKLKANCDDEKVRVLEGSLTINELAAVIGKAVLVITNDTGPMHLAEALNIPTIAIFLTHNYERCFFYHSKAEVKSFSVINENPDSFLMLPKPNKVIEEIINYFQIKHSKG